MKLCKKTPILVNEEQDTWRVLVGDSAIIFQCNQEEADTRMILHACREDTNVVVDSKDTDVLVLMIYAFTIHRPTSEWLMKIEAERYVNIRKILNHFGEDLCLKLPRIHAITGCDTTSFLHGVGKVLRLIKKSIKSLECLKLLDGFGDSADVSNNLHDGVSKFIQTICYNGQDDESLVETKVRLYMRMKVKSSLTLPPDPKSMKQHILRNAFSCLVG